MGIPISAKETHLLKLVNKNYELSQPKSKENYRTRKERQ